MCLMIDKQAEEAAELQYIDELLATSVADSLVLLPDRPFVWLELYGSMPADIRRTSLPWLIEDYRQCKKEATQLTVKLPQYK